MQVILTEKEYDELKAKAHPSEDELVKGLVEIASKHIKKANEKNKILHLVDEEQEEQRGIRYTQYLDELSDKPWLPPRKVKYIVTVERVEEEE